MDVRRRRCRILGACSRRAIGVWLGKRLHDRLPQQRLFFWCYLLLAVAAVKLLVDAMKALLS